jgi:hypothetical protein
MSQLCCTSPIQGGHRTCLDILGGMVEVHGTLMFKKQACHCKSNLWLGWTNNKRTK